MQIYNKGAKEKRCGRKKTQRKKRRIKAHLDPHLHQLRNYEASHNYGGLKIKYILLPAAFIKNTRLVVAKSPITSI